MRTDQWSLLLALSVSLLTAACSSQKVRHSIKDYPKDVVTLDQGWDDDSRARFYHSPQGSPIMPYAWFIALEQPGSKAPFRDPAFLESFGLIHWGSSPTLNPDGLPVGLTRDQDIYRDDYEPKLGMNCGACHVGMMTVGGKKVLLDGAPSHFDMWSFMTALKNALQETATDKGKDGKFERFARAVLQKAGGQAPSASDVKHLKQRLDAVLREREDWASRNKPYRKPGPGRVDALNIILNQVTAKMLDRPGNAQMADAPVSYPFVWDAPYLDWVQYNGAVNNVGAGAIGRNVGQVLGVFGEASMVQALGYPNSVNVNHLVDLEETMKTLWAPRWQEMADRGILPPLSTQKVDKGRDVFAGTCAKCHQVIDSSTKRTPGSIKVTKVNAAAIGTDPAATRGFATRMVETGPLRNRKLNYYGGPHFGDSAYAADVLQHVTTGVMINDLTQHARTGFVARLVGGEIMATIRGWLGGDKGKQAREETPDVDTLAHLEDEMEDLKEGLEDRFEAEHPEAHCSADTRPQEYRARPLNGIWATGPYLHNGSVPTLADLLKPPH
jgi:hypothetical protein